MLLTITTQTRPATDIGYLVGKNPARVQSFSLAFGTAHVFFPEATEGRCTVALLLDLDPLDLVRSARRSQKSDSLLTQYVNDRPYASSSYMSVAIARVFRSAIRGDSKERPELAANPMDLVARVSALPARSGEARLRELFEPLGYQLSVQTEPLDPHFPDWGPSPYVNVTLTAEVRLSELLTHLYVLLPVLDGGKHYWVGEDEVEKLLAKGGDWLNDHPSRDYIVSRYLKRRRHLSEIAIARLDEGHDDDGDDDVDDPVEAVIERHVSLNEQRLGAVTAEVIRLGARSVADVGCGEGKLVRALLRERSIQRILAMDVSSRALDIAQSRLRLDTMPARQRARVELIQGSLTYRDARLDGFDVLCAVEVIEHLDPWRLEAFEDVVFGAARPEAVVITTPNAEYNVRFEGLPAGRFRHADHRFEWDRTQFATWATRVAAAHGYEVDFSGIGPVDDVVGTPTQMATFRREVAS